MPFMQDHDAPAVCSLDPALQGAHIVRVLNLPYRLDNDNDAATTVMVPDLTNFVDRDEFVAKGSVGEVYKGKWMHVHDASVARSKPVLPRVAVKLIPLSAHHSSNELNTRYRNMKRELELWTRLRHNNILPLLGIACIDGSQSLPALILPWMENGTVTEYLKNNPSIPPFRFLQDIIEGLNYLHTFDPPIIHGNLKAANVLVNHRREAYLADFAMNRFLADDNISRTVVASMPVMLRWMGPELFIGQETKPTKAADMYSYGMTCWEILARQVPFRSVHNAAIIIIKVVRGERPPRVVAWHPKEIWEISMQCWAQDPASRPSSQAVLSSMREAVKHLESSNPPTSTTLPQQTEKSRLRRPALVHYSSDRDRDAERISIASTDSSSSQDCSSVPRSGFLLPVVSAFKQAWTALQHSKARLTKALLVGKRRCI